MTNDAQRHGVTAASPPNATPRKLSLTEFWFDIYCKLSPPRSIVRVRRALVDLQLAGRYKGRIPRQDALSALAKQGDWEVRARAYDGEIYRYYVERRAREVADENFDMALMLETFAAIAVPMATERIPMAGPGELMRAATQALEAAALLRGKPTARLQIYDDTTGRDRARELEEFAKLARGRLGPPAKQITAKANGHGNGHAGSGNGSGNGNGHDMAARSNGHGPDTE